MGSVEISVEDLMKKLASAGKDDSILPEMKIHRFPTCLQGLGDRHIVPKLVAIGPYHHGKDHLKKMEEVKRAAAFHLNNRWGDEFPLHKTYKAVLDVAGDARKRYSELPTDKNEAGFVEMMFIDACFLLRYMEAFYRPKKKEEKDDKKKEEKDDACFLLRYTEVFFRAEEKKEEKRDDKDDVYVGDASLQKLLFSNRACIDSDIMLLENQLPWLVVQTVIDSLPLKQRNYYNQVAEAFIAHMGNGFKILEGKEQKGCSIMQVVKGEEARARDDTPHLLGLLWRYKTGEERRRPKPPKVEQISACSAMELAEIGIKLTASRTALFSDMEVNRSYWPVWGKKLSLAPLSLDSTRACCLVNMAAFEVATRSGFGDHPNRTAVCSYLALFSMFMLREEDVQELRAKGILQGHKSNADMLDFFKSVVEHLPDAGFRYALTMASIAQYKKRRWMWTKVHKFIYNNLGTIITVLTVLATLVGLFQAFLAFRHKK